ncbi:unnamed protein product, partial [Ectocarpus sp. 12 AP-2014]
MLLRMSEPSPPPPPPPPPSSPRGRPFVGTGAAAAAAAVPWELAEGSGAANLRAIMAAAAAAMADGAVGAHADAARALSCAAIDPAGGAPSFAATTPVPAAAAGGLCGPALAAVFLAATRTARGFR